MNLLQLGEFTLHSGQTSRYKIECDALTLADWSCAADMIARAAGPFGRVLGVATGGIRLAQLLGPKMDPEAKKVIIVDDVATTGRSIVEVVRNIEIERVQEMIDLDNPNWMKPKIEWEAWVVFWRGSFWPPSWLHALFTLHPGIPR